MLLEAHSHFSFGEGCLSPLELAQAAAKAGHRSLGLCDNDGLYGMVEFYRAALAEGLKPVLGLRLSALAGALLLARGETGRRELCRLATLAQLGDESPWLRQSEDSLPKRGPGSPLDHASPWQRTRAEATGTAQQLREAIAELQDCELILPSLEALAALRELPGGLNPAWVSVGVHPVLGRQRANEVWSAARAAGLPCVPHLPVYHETPVDQELHRLLRAIATGDTLARARPVCASGHLVTPEELRRPFSTLPETLRRLDEMEERCRLELELGRLHMPDPELPAGVNATDVLWERCLRGLRQHYPAPGPDGLPVSQEEAALRLQREVRVIDAMHFSGYFLVVDEILDFARENGLPWVGRGSAANSLVAYCLGFTEVDPIRHKLYFERFLNPQRSSPPDIDLDFSWTDRDRVLANVYHRFGHERVAMICTTITFGPRAAVRETAKAMGIGGDGLKRLTDNLPHSARDLQEMLAEEGQPRLRARGLRPDLEPLASVLPFALRLMGRPRHLGIHAGGIVVSPDAVYERMPLQRASKGLCVTQLDMHPVEELGLVKIDLLAQRGLGVYSDLVRDLEQRGLPPVPFSVEELEADPAVQSMMAEGRSMGCFYIESPGMRALLRKLRCADFGTLVAASSIIRPGVSESGMMQAYIERHLDPAKAHYLHPRLQEVLADTYGVMVYQEDVIKVTHALAGMDLAEGDLLRRAMCGKSTEPGALARTRKRFLDGCRGNGIEDAIALEVWRQIRSFAGYAFCKAHSASFAVLSMRVAWIKVHHPAEFMAAVLSNQGGYYGCAAYVQEARRMGLRLLPPDVSHGDGVWKGSGNTLRVGLAQVGSLSSAALRRLLRERARAPWRGIRDLRRRTGLAQDELEALILCGACDSLGEPGEDSRHLRPRLLWAARLEQQTPADEGLLPLDDLPAVPSSLMLSGLELWQHERRLLGFGVHHHPLALYDFGELPAHCVDSRELRNRPAGTRVCMLGWNYSRKVILTRSKEQAQPLPIDANDDARAPARLPTVAAAPVLAESARRREAMSFLSMEDLQGTWEAVLFPRVYERHQLLCREHGPFLLEGKVEYEAGEAMLIVSDMRRIGRLRQLNRTLAHGQVEESLTT